MYISYSQEKRKKRNFEMEGREIEFTSNARQFQQNRDQGCLLVGEWRGKEVACSLRSVGQFSVCSVGCFRELRGE